MAEQKVAVNKSEEIRQLLKLNPKISGKEAIEVLEQQGITISNNLFYLVKGKVMGRKRRRRKAQQLVTRVATTTGDGDAVKTILKVKAFASDLGGLKKLKALVDALSE